MAEVVGAIASGITLAALFKICLDAFELFETAKSTNKDLHGLVIRMNMEKCRLYTWGEAMGLVAAPPAGSVRPIDALPFQSTAREALKEIYRLLNDSANIQSRYGCETILISAQDSSSDSLADLSTSFSHFAVSGHSKQVFAKNRLIAKTRWAISDRKKFVGLIADVRSFVDALQDITRPISTVARQEGMLRYGIQQINNVDTLEVIAEACQADYPDVSDAASIKMDVLTVATSRRLEIEVWADLVARDDSDTTSTALQAENKDEIPLESSILPSALPPDMLLELSRESRRMAGELERAREEYAKVQKEKNEITRELEDLTAALFKEANAMVADARDEMMAMERKYEELRKQYGTS
jgi:Prion-inhibition and propagation/GDP/GTP exchange factor Sec2p